MDIGPAEFRRISAYIYDELGIRLTDNKRTMLAGRLHKRLRELQLATVSDYCDYLFSPRGQQLEKIHLFNAVTTNKTDFFREPSHFDYLVGQVLPAWQRLGRRSFRVWSAGCSSGEEPYTLAMVLDDYARQHSDFVFEIIATDISTRVLDQAKQAVYHEERIAPVPMALRRRYLLRSRDRTSPLVRIVPELRRHVRFGRLNFMDEQFALPFVLDVIFCRNVIIYFDHPTQERLVQKFCRHLQPDGHLFLGHSESLHGYAVPLQQIAPTVYRHQPALAAV
ncbi:CheR family methyltransferase [Desulfuromonas thiophila]|uniref:protein-glutamate O-methyltransferase n=1 Tax=Desulfuromonas thiophila TaxID=57664 RepID=A0A1G7E3M3_9BACT|nr:protein-glutamate O-methyltransferase [Desulfuromonas thiophila]SDE58313.1 MCP methyltransferase, CheR-type [Desulfuromonas thiophila]